MSLTFLLESYDASLEVRVQEAEAASTEVENFENRIAAYENWIGSPAEYLGSDVVGNLSTNYNTVTTLLGVLTGAVNTTNVKVNALCAKVINIQSALQSRGITAEA